MRFSAIPATVRGALWMVLSCAILSVLAGLGRHIAASGMHPFQIVFFRLAFALVFMLPWLAYAGIGTLKTTRLKLYSFRAVLSMFAMTTWFYAISLLPIAEVTALSFLAPLFATVGAALVLRETVRLRRWTATLAGFMGALVIIRPGVIEMTLGSWMALASAVFMGLSVLVIKSLTRTERANTVVFYMSLFMTPMALGPALLVWQPPPTDLWIWLVLMGPVATLGHITLVRAFAVADASAVVPFDFSRLPFAVLVGWIAFGEVADMWTWVGAAIIFTSSVYIARREVRLGRVAAAPAAGGGAGPRAK